MYVCPLEEQTPPQQIMGVRLSMEVRGGRDYQVAKQNAQVLNGHMARRQEDGGLEIASEEKKVPPGPKAHSTNGRKAALMADETH